MKRAVFILLCIGFSGAAIIGIYNLLYAGIYEAEVLPDICDYHNKKDVKTSFLFDLFFPSTESNGCHPGPHLFMWFFVLATGIGSGILSGRIVMRLFGSKN
jgi:hypothetical protein